MVTMRQRTLRQGAVGLVVLCTAAFGTPAQATAKDAGGARNLVVQAGRSAQATHHRLALVIGNAAYKDAPLLNPVNDARAMAQALEAAGFTVMLRLDIDHRGMLGALRDFGTQLRQGGVGLFYFAGHGMQIKGRNYLIPVGSDIEREDEVAYASLDAQAVLDKMEAAGSGANLMILDACRNNPFARSFRSVNRGLAQMEAPVGTLVAFATAPGTVASDGQGANGLYTQHLLRAMSKPGSKVEDVFKQVRAAVRRDSKGMQVPWEATSLEGDLFFVEPLAPLAQPVPPDPHKALDLALWDAVKASTEPVEVRAYLSRFPTGQFAAQALLLLARLEAAQQPVAPPAALVAAPPPRPTEPARPDSLAPSVPVGEPDRAAATQLLTPPVEALNGNYWTVEAVTRQRLQRLREEPSALVSSELPLIDAPRREPAPGVDTASSTPGPAGSRVGDRWVYNEVDVWTRTAATQLMLRLDSYSDRGDPHYDWTPGKDSPQANLARTLLWPRAYSFEPREQLQVWWSWMKEGDSYRVTVPGVVRRSNGTVIASHAAVTMSHKGRERIRVPAGEFEAIRIDAAGVTEFVALSGALAKQHWSANFWYVPQLLGFAAMHTDIRESGGFLPVVRRRIELLRFEPAATVQASRQ